MKDVNKKNHKNIKTAFDKTFNANIKIKRRRRNIAFQKKELFVSTIGSYEEQLRRQVELIANYNIDLSRYEEPFYDIIDKTLRLSFGEKIYELIAFYLYDRIGPDGMINPLVLDMNIPPIFLETPEQLYGLIVKLYPNAL